MVVNSDNLALRLLSLKSEPDPARKRLVALAIVSERLRQDSIEPILVGGAAVEFYTMGGYATKDVDLALSHCPEVDQAFADLGFSKEGRYWVHVELDLLFEAPADPDLPGETAPRKRVQIEGMEVVILGLEDLIMDRLQMWIHGQSDEDGRWATRLAMLYSEEIDWGYLEEKTRAIPKERSALLSIKEAAHDQA